jgi:hypothetical protein
MADPHLNGQSIEQPEVDGRHDKHIDGSDVRGVIGWKTRDDAERLRDFMDHQRRWA